MQLPFLSIFSVGTNIGDCPAEICTYVPNKRISNKLTKYTALFSLRKIHDNTKMNMKNISQKQIIQKLVMQQ